MSDRLHLMWVNLKIAVLSHSKAEEGFAAILRGKLGSEPCAAFSRHPLHT